MDPISGISGADPLARRTVTINLNASTAIDPARVLAAARNLSTNTHYKRYGSTIEFYVPNMYMYRFVNNAKGNGLDVII